MTRMLDSIIHKTVMPLRNALRTAFTCLTGLEVMRRLPFGVNKFADIRSVWPHLEMRTILDIGANVGQSALEFRKNWPLAQIHCCEPIAAIHMKLLNRVKSPLTRCHHLAIGAKREKSIMYVPDEATRSDISSLHGGHPALVGRAVHEELVEVITLDHLLEQEKIGRADYLKIDTEGHDMLVLEGAKDLFRARRIGIVEVEVGMNPENNFHVPLAQAVDMMFRAGHHLFGLYEPMHEWPTQRPILRRCNALFIPDSIARSGAWAPF